MTDVTPPPAPQPTPYASTVEPTSPAVAFERTPYAAAPAGGKVNVLGIVALVLSILWISIPAVVCGHIAMKQIKTRGESGRGFAIASLILGYIGILLGIVVTIILIPVFIIGTVGFV